MEKRIEFQPAYDKRNTNPSKNYGIHGVNIRFLYGDSERGFVQFLLFTNWQLPHVQIEHDKRTIQKILAGDSLYLREPHWGVLPMPADLGYHSPQPCREGHEPYDCDLLPQGKCYYDGSGLNAEPVYDRLLREGSDGVWATLEDYWQSIFGSPSHEVLPDEDS